MKYFRRLQNINWISQTTPKKDVTQTKVYLVDFKKIAQIKKEIIEDRKRLKNCEDFNLLKMV